MNDIQKLREETNAKEHKAILDSIKDMKLSLVSKNEFRPVRNVVYSMVVIIMAYVLESLLGTIVQAMSLA